MSRSGGGSDDAGSESPPLADAPKETDQQQLEAATAMSDGGPGDRSTEPADDGSDGDGHESVTSPDEASLEANLATAIDALQSVEEVLISD